MRGLLLSAVALLVGCYDSSFGERTGPVAAVPATATLSDLRGLFAGPTFVVSTDITVTGRVTTSDRSENFYRTFCIEADGAGLEIMAGLDHLHNDYPEGCTVTVRLQGRALGESRGVLQLGRMPSAGSSYPTDYIASRPALDATIIRNDEPLLSVNPAVRMLGDLTPAMCGTLVQVEGLHYEPEELSAGSWAGYKRFADDDGTAVYTYVRSYARFADAEVPAGRCSLTGILQYDGSRYILKLRDENDCVLR
ncbi:MAG: hypothetical protein K2I32_04855 [Alistipes sp.]|nr:hypothetical protein [Alistipes sp.]